MIMKTAPSFEQELWNLPGFQSLLHPSSFSIPVSEFNPWENFYKEEKGSASHEGLDWQLRAFPDFSGHIESMSNIEAFVRIMLSSLAKHLGPSLISAYLRNRSGEYYLILRHRGKLFVSEKNNRIEKEKEERFIQCVEKGEYLILENETEAVFPLPSRFGPMGLLHFQKEKGVIKEEILKKLWYEIRKYGENLLQACIYERLTVEPESTLLNGMRFQEDLRRETACRLEKNIPTHLVLLQFHSEPDSKLSAFFGQTLRQRFPFPARLYRITALLFAALISQNAVKKLEIMLMEFLTLVSREYPFELSLGSALPDYALKSPEEWFCLAQSNMEKVHL